MRREAVALGDKQALLEHETRTRERFEKLVPRAQVMLGGTGFGIRIDFTIPTLTFDHNTREVCINPNFIERRKLTQAEQEYVFFHEIGHFAQLADDSDVYLGTFEQAKTEAHTHPEAISPYVEAAWNHFFNAFDDMDTNAKVEARNPTLQKNEGADTTSVRSALYRKIVAGSLNGKPKTEQFNFAVLHAVMLPNDERLQVDEDVKNRLEAPYAYLGKGYASFYAFAKEKFFDGKLDYGNFRSRARRAAEPLFREFLTIDLASGDIEKVQRSPDLCGEARDGKEAGRIADGIKRAREGASKRAGRSQRDRLTNLMREQGFSEQEVRRMLEIQEKTKEAYTKMIDIWEHLFTVMPFFEREIQTGFRSGQEFDVEAFVGQIDRFLTNPDALRVFSRDVLEPAGERVEPRLIDLRLILDASGSMNTDRKNITQESAFALCMSLLQFYRNRKFSEGDTAAIEICFSIHGFGDNTEVFLKIDQATWENDLENPHKIEMLLMRALFDYHRTDLGGTQDNGALQIAYNDLNAPDVLAKLKNGDAVALIFEVTDGETTTAIDSASTKTLLDTIPNVSSHGLKIPGSLQPDTPPIPNKNEGGHASEIVQASNAFTTVWGKDGHLLPDIRSLPEALLKILGKLVTERNNGKEL